MPTTQHTSPQSKTKRYSHGNQATSWHGNHSVPPVASQIDKNNYWRKDDNLSHGYLYTSNHNKLDTSRTVKIANSNVSNNSTPLWTTTTTTTTTTATTATTAAAAATNMGRLLSIDTNVNNLPIQTISSPHSTEVIQQESRSYPVMSDYTNHNLHHSLSDSVIIPLSAHQCSNEPFHTAVSHSSELPPACRVEETALSFSLDGQKYSNICKKWPSTELYHDSDDDFNSNRADHDSEDVVTMNNDGQVIDNNNNDNSNNVVVVDIDSNSSTELAGEPVDNDIDFLKSCFPNILADQVLTVYNDCECNIETAVGRLLQLPTSPMDFSEVWQENEEVRKVFQEECSGQTVEEVTEDIQTTCMDEEVARALQEQMDKALIEEKSNGLATSKALVSQNEPCSVNGSGEDEGLILRLSPSLASKLQDMFGSVKEYLIADGEL